jgi:hypothetical protein
LRWLHISALRKLIAMALEVLLLALLWLLLLLLVLPGSSVSN